MGFMVNTARTYPLYARARGEAYAGLFLLLLGLTVLTFRACPVSTAVNHRIIGRPVRTNGGTLPPSVGYGSASEDGHRHKGWWVGHFATGSMQHTRNFETKWATHAAGAKHDGWATNDVATSMAVLISGRHRLQFRNSGVVLENQGDYVIWGPGVPHSWTALEKSTILCVRWPSLPGDQRMPTASNSSELVVRMDATEGTQPVEVDSAARFDVKSLTNGVNE